MGACMLHEINGPNGGVIIEDRDFTSIRTATTPNDTHVCDTPAGTAGQLDGLTSAAPSRPASSGAIDMNSLFSVQGMVAVVTGGGTGIGLTMAHTLLRSGASKVFILGRRLNVLESAARDFHSSFGGPGEMIPLQCDITSKESLLAAADAVAQQAGHVNLLCCNAGVLGPDPIVAHPAPPPLRQWRERMLAVDMDAFTRTLHVNVTGGWFTLLAFLELLDRGNARAVRGGGDGARAFGAPDGPRARAAAVPSVQSQVIFTSSISAISRGRVARVSYSASKAAMLHVVQKASSMLAPYGIRVNALAPGLFPSSMVDSSIAQRDPGLESYDYHSFIPCRSFGSEKQMAGSLLYLASPSGSYCNGMILVIDGGRLSVMNAVVNW